MLSQLSPRQQNGLFGIGGIALLACVYVGASKMRTPAPMKLEEMPAATPIASPPHAQSETPVAESVATRAKVVVHVAGAVRRPGVVHAKPGARVDDAIRMAGGAKPNADLDRINLAAKLEDGTQLFIPPRGPRVVARPAASPRPLRGSVPTALAPFSPGEVAVVYQGGPTASPGRSAAQAPLEPKPESAAAAPASGTVSLNSATLEELDSLPGVGPATAQKILDYRKDHGPFASIDELLEVSGIGAKKLEKMRARLAL